MYSEFEEIALTQEREFSPIRMQAHWELSVSLQMMGLNITRFELKVIFFSPEPLPSPTFNCTLTDEDIIVHCEIPENYSSYTDLIRYSWRCHSAQCNNSSEPVMHFSKKGDLSQEVQCIISNPLFERTSSIVLGTCVPSGESIPKCARTGVLCTYGAHGPAVVCGFQCNSQMWLRPQFLKCKISYRSPTCPVIHVMLTFVTLSVSSTILIRVLVIILILWGKTKTQGVYVACPRSIAESGFEIRPSGSGACALNYLQYCFIIFSITITFSKNARELQEYVFDTFV